MRKTAGTVAAVIVLAAYMMTGCGENYVKTGTELLEQQKYEEAQDTFEQALKADDSDPEAYRGRGIAKWELEDYEGALEDFQAVLDNGGKKTGELYNLMGNCAMKLENPQKALNLYRLGLEDENIGEELRREMRLNEIAAYEKTGDIESAKAKLKTYVEDYPDDEKAAKEAEFLETR